MKKMTTGLALLLLLSACGTSDEATNGSTESTGTEQTEEASEETVNEQPEEVTEEAAEETVEEAGDAEESSEEAAEESTEEAAEDQQETEEVSGTNLTAYQPEAGTVYVFEQDGIEIQREITDVQGNLVQEIVTFGDIETLNIYEWTADTISTVYTEENPIETDGLLETFEAADAPQNVMSINPSAADVEGEWKFVAAEEQVDTAHGSFENVIVFENELTSENSDQVTTFTYYYGEGTGLIKEEIEVTGDNGYTTVSELKEIR